MRAKKYHKAKYRKAVAATVGGAAMVSSAMAFGAGWDGSYGPSGGGDQESLQQKIELLRQKVKYVFVIFHENQSFDHFFGTYPGANGLFEAPKGFTPANKTPSFTQRYLDTSLNVKTISPFLMPQAVVGAGKVIPIYPADEISVDHSHQGMANGLDVNAKTGIAANDRYAMDQEGLTTNASDDIVTSAGAAPTSITLAAAQKAEDDVAHLDCDTIPFMWSWAKHFVLFDNFHQTIVGPSTPNAIAVIAGQSGETQWALHPNEGAAVTYANPSFPNVLGATYKSQVSSTNTNAYVPMVGDAGPLPGSNLDTNKGAKPPYNTDESAANPALNLTFATQPLSFMGSDIEKIIKSDPNPGADLLDVQSDIREIASFNRPVNWGWYQQGFDANDTPDPHSGISPNSGSQAYLSGYVLHHNAPQFFAYLSDNPQVLDANLHGAKDFFDAVEGRTLPKDGGVFYLRGGYDNNDGLVPVDPTPAVENAFLGNDDHASYSDQQISEALAGRAISDVANSPYWAQSAIIITYDETDGYYDHDVPSKRSTFADGSILEAGPRIPTIVISPYAAGGTISHQYSEHGSVIKFINELKGLVPLARLPDEERGRNLGKINLGQENLGPSDDPDNQLGDLTEAFDTGRLTGEKPPIPGLEAAFTPAQIKKLPHLATPGYSTNGYTNGACAAIGVLPTDFETFADYKSGKPIDPYPENVNPRPTASPGTPTSGSWTP
jgi:phospholipase C